jgi:7-cyano-7-deazaguanine reductase
MQKYSGNMDEVIEQVTTTIANDLSELLETDVKVNIFLCTDLQHSTSAPLHGTYTTIESTVSLPQLTCTIYKENPLILRGQKTETLYENNYHSSLLKSNCRVTSQPDWGDVYIYYKGEYDISKESLLRYIVSFRDECHFHEEICETIYKRLWDAFEPLELCVTCLYVRRGGIDINPTRASHSHLLDVDLINEKVPYVKTLRQ